MQGRLTRELVAIGATTARAIPRAASCVRAGPHFVAI